ncbi:TPM domain-containing protein [Pedobacter africanus]|uniref:TPM domain-containing protein n=1 Tax=Pedobacter africanus TaxID=151894 RepID=A0A1W2CN15_9SPHI|nr:TPM domain-containing protein [Pedobacter africanus]SMC86635.1 uncharacterized protein SAMN04488524_3031 [Pedobacter africanus]
MKYALILLFLSVFTISGCQQSKKDVLSKIPDPKSLNETYVSNPDGILSAETVAALNSKLSPLDQAGTAHIDVVFVKSIGEHVPKDIAHELFRAWKIGSSETNNGLLVFVVEDQRRIEFETGYGLEGILPDMICKRIQEDYMIPHARNNNFDLAITQGVDALIRRLNSQSAEPYADPATDDPGPAVDIVPPPPIDMAVPAQEPVADSATAASPQTEAIQPLLQQQPVQQRSGPIADWLTICIFIVYAIFAWPIAAVLYRYQFKRQWLNPFAYFITFGPPIFVVYLNLYHPGDWYNVRALLILLAFIWLYVNLHFLILSSLLKASLSGKSRHQQYLVWRKSHEPAEHAVLKFFSFPFLKAYWKNYADAQYQRRFASYNCAACSNPMECLDDDKEDQFLSKGQLAEEKVDAVDYDVWECRSCNNIMILDYSNLKSKVKECPECKFKTLKYRDRKIVKRATRYAPGYGDEYYICANCKFLETIRFEIAQIPTPSSSSSSSSSGSSSFSSSSSSSSSSTSSGGSSGGGGAGSSW